MIVACDAKHGRVLGFAEVDARPLGSNKNGSSGNESSLTEGASDDILRSYMYNLAVDKTWKRKGIASALVQACEQYVSDMHDLCVEKRLYLRVRKFNHAAIALYESLGYREMLPEVIRLSKDDINSGSLEDGELILFAKDLPMGEECPMD
jgi:ribosomal protein S18 acetylase RimI-like enzyme